MMEIVSSTKKYAVNFPAGFDFIDRLRSIAHVYFVIDKNVFHLYRNSAFLSFSDNDRYLIDAVEEKKTIETALGICEQMTNLPSKRNTVLVSIGGGIVQDITGFVADILYRGIRWVFIPTTLLAACDSCIGGKTSLNYKDYKNLLGTFYPPDDIYICSKFFQTLTDRDFNSGLGEVVKFNILYGKEGIRRVEDDIHRLVAREDDAIRNYVESSLKFKKAFIEVDEFDRGERMKLNFAHTFGHAIESVTKYKIPHGTAVAMGTIVANHISLGRGWLKEDTFVRIGHLMKKIVDSDYKEFDMKNSGILAAIRKDKKQIDQGIRAVLMKGDGSMAIVNDVTEDEVFDGFEYMRAFLFGFGT